MKKGLGEMERRLFAYMQMRGQSTLRAGELASPMQLSVSQERNLLSRLAQAGLIARVKRGLYLVPRRLPLGSVWTPNEALALNTLMESVKGRYQICGPNAFNRYGFDEQIPNRVYAYNNRLTGDRTVGALEISLIRVADQRLGDTDEFKTADGDSMVYASRVRTLVDSVYDWSRFNSLPRGYRWIRAELRSERVAPAALVRVALKYGDVGTIRRLGHLLELEDVDEKLLLRLERALSPSTGLIPWVPRLPKRGKVNQRWGIVENDAEGEGT